MTMASDTISAQQRAGVSLRKTNKPLMEKRRRARINNSLTQLKSLVIQGSKKDSSQFNKLEKADILELTVKHLRGLQEQQQQNLTQTTRETALTGKYQAGFMECANEVIRYLGQSQGFSDDIKSRVIQHLASCIQLSSKPYTKPVQPATTVSTPTAIPTGPQVISSQIVNGQVIHIVNSQFQNIKPANTSYPTLQQASVTPMTTVSSASTQNQPANVSVMTTATPATEPHSYIKYTQPLQIQIPPVLSPVIIQSKALQIQNPTRPQLNQKIQDVAPHMNPLVINPRLANPKQETTPFTNSPPPQAKEPTLATPYSRTCQNPKNYYTINDMQYSDIPRSRTCSLTSSSSDSELSSPLNLSHSPEYYTLRDVNNNNKYPSPVDSYYNQTSIKEDYNQTHSKGDKLSTYSITRDGYFLSQYPPSSCTSVIVDGRKILDAQSIKYMHFMDEDRHFIRHEGSTSPASSVGEERLWRPW